MIHRDALDTNIVFSFDFRSHTNANSFSFVDCFQK